MGMGRLNSRGNLVFTNAEAAELERRAALARLEYDSMCPDNLKYARKALDMSIYELADYLEVSSELVSAWENVMGIIPERCFQELVGTLNVLAPQ